MYQEKQLQQLQEFSWGLIKDMFSVWLKLTDKLLDLGLFQFYFVFFFFLIETSLWEIKAEIKDFCNNNSERQLHN